MSSYTVVTGRQLSLGFMPLSQKTDIGAVLFRIIVCHQNTDALRKQRLTLSKTALPFQFSLGYVRENLAIILEAA